MHFIALISPNSHLPYKSISIFVAEIHEAAFVFLNTRSRVIWRLFSQTCFLTSHSSSAWQHLPSTRAVLGPFRCWISQQKRVVPRQYFLAITIFPPPPDLNFLCWLFWFKTQMGFWKKYVLDTMGKFLNYHRIQLGTSKNPANERLIAFRNTTEIVAPAVLTSYSAPWRSD